MVTRCSSTIALGAKFHTYNSMTGVLLLRRRLINMKEVLALALALAFANGVEAQTQVYKCIEGGKVAYSNIPCPDGKKLDVKPPRGVNYEGKGKVRSTD